MLSGQTQPATVLSTDQNTSDNICILTNGPTLLEELTELLATKRKFEILLIDSQKSGFLFPVEIFFETTNLAKQLLDIEGFLIFLTTNRALAIKKETILGN